MDDEITYELIIDGEEPISIGTKTSYDTLKLNPGKHTIVVKGYCEHGYVNQDSIIVTIPEQCHINDTDIKYEYDNNTYMISWNISNPYISSENLYYSISIDGDTPFITDKQSYDISWQNPGDHSFQINTTCKHKNTTELQTYNYSLKDPIDDIKLTLNNKDTPLKNAKFIEYNIQLPSVSNDINYAYDNYKYYLTFDNKTIDLTSLHGIRQFYDLNIGDHKLVLSAQCKHNNTKSVQKIFNITEQLYNGYYYTNINDSLDIIFLYNSNEKSFFAQYYNNEPKLFLCDVKDNIIFVKDFNMQFVAQYNIFDNKIDKIGNDPITGRAITVASYVLSGNIRTNNGDTLYLELNNKNFAGPVITDIYLDENVLSFNIKKDSYVSNDTHPDWPLTFMPFFMMSDDTSNPHVVSFNDIGGSIIEHDDHITYMLPRAYYTDDGSFINLIDHIVPFWGIHYNSNMIFNASYYEMNTIQLNWNTNNYILNPDNYTEMQYLPDIIKKYTIADKIAVFLRHSENDTGDAYSRLTEHGTTYAVGTGIDLANTQLLNKQNTLLYASCEEQNVTTAQLIGQKIFNDENYPTIYQNPEIVPIYTEATDWPTIAAFPTSDPQRTLFHTISQNTCTKLLDLIGDKKYAICIESAQNILPLVKWGSRNLIQFNFNGQPGDPWLCYLAGVAVIKIKYNITVIPVYLIHNYITDDGGVTITPGDNGYHGIMRDKDNYGYGNVLHSNL